MDLHLYLDILNRLYFICIQIIQTLTLVLSLTLILTYRIKVSEIEYFQSRNMSKTSGNASTTCVRGFILRVGTPPWFSIQNGGILFLYGFLGL